MAVGRESTAIIFYCSVMTAQSFCKTALCVAMAGIAILLPACTGTYRYVSEADAGVAEPPSTIGPVPHPKSTTLGFAARWNQAGGTHLSSSVNAGDGFLQGRRGDYDVGWESGSIGLDGRLTLNLEDAPGSTLALMDLYATINSRVGDPWWTSASLGGIGLTFPLSWAYFRMSSAIGQHRYRMTVTEVTVEGDCLDECTYTPRTYHVKDGSPLFGWSTTFWWPTDLTGFSLTPYLGYQYMRAYLLVDDHWIETFTLRHHAVALGLRYESRWANPTVTFSLESLRHGSSDALYAKLAVGLEKTFGKTDD